VQPKSKDGQQLLDAGKVFLGQGRLDVAFELFNEALAIFHQVYGPLHPDTALCYGCVLLSLSLSLSHGVRISAVASTHWSPVGCAPRCIG
jgi:hypothetical protein